MVSPESIAEIRFCIAVSKLPDEEEVALLVEVVEADDVLLSEVKSDVLCRPEMFIGTILWKSLPACQTPAAHGSCFY